MNSDLPHSDTDTAVDQEAGLAHSPLPTNAPFCLGLAERGGQEEGGWKRLAAPDFTRLRSLGSTTACGLYPHSLHLEVGWKVRALRQAFKLPPVQACRCGGVTDVGTPRRSGLSSQIVTPAESPTSYPDSLSPPPLPSICLSTNGATQGTRGHWGSLFGMGKSQL